MGNFKIFEDLQNCKKIMAYLSLRISTFLRLDFLFKFHEYMLNRTLFGLNLQYILANKLNFANQKCTVEHISMKLEKFHVVKAIKKRRNSLT